MDVKPIAIVVVAIIFFLSCNKDNNTPPAAPSEKSKLSAIIDWAGPYGFDNTDAFQVTYTGDRITRLKNQFGEQMTFEYGSFVGLPQIIRVRSLMNGSTIINDTLNYSSDKLMRISGMFSNYAPLYDISTRFSLIWDPTQSTDNQMFYYGNLGIEGRFTYRADYNNSGDIQTLEYYYLDNGNSYLQYKVDVSYTTKENTLLKVDSLLAIMDPSCRDAQFRLALCNDEDVSTYPFSIYYGTKCIDSISRTRYTWNSGDISSIPFEEKIKHVSYEFNQKGNVTKILIENTPFKEFVYAQ